MRHIKQHIQFTIILLFILTRFKCNAQDHEFGFSIGGGANYFAYTQPSLDNMFDSYNDILKQKLTGKLEYLRPSYAYHVNGEFLVGSIFRIGLTRNFIKSESSVHLINGEQRKIKLVMKEWDWNFDIMTPSFKKTQIGFALATNFQNAILFCSYKHKNGYESYISGNDVIGLSGVYRAMSDAPISIGLRVNRNMGKRIFLAIKIDRVLKGGGQKLLPHRDEFHAGSESGFTLGGGYLPFYLPVDLNFAGNNYYTNVGNQNVFGSFKGWRVMASLNIFLFKKTVN